MRTDHCGALFGAVTALVPLAVSAAPPALMLANDFHADIAIQNYLVSEKLDGIRAYWDGQQLLSRAGNPISAPAWFTRGWPARPMDGELWLGHGRFAELSGIVRSYRPDNRQWRKVRYMVFDLPAETSDFALRYAELQKRVKRLDRPWVVAVEQRRLTTLDALDTRLDRVSASGGEGLMLHRANSLYRAGRSEDLLKYKRFQDAEATVIGYEPGAGKYEGLVGALLVQDEQGRRFRLGSGLDDDERRTPPPLGSRVTYRYNGLTATGLPRFARFLRIRPDE